MNKFIKEALKNYFLSYGLTVLIILMQPIQENIGTEFLRYMAVLMFVISTGSTFAFQPHFRHINIWIRRLILWIYMSITINIGTYIYVNHILKSSVDLILMIITPVSIFILGFIAYFIADKIEEDKIRQMNESLKEYNKNNDDNL